MAQLRIFAKGNVDVRESLMVCRVGGRVAWNGLNQALRENGSSDLVRVRHETWSRSDALVTAPLGIPDEVIAQRLDLGPYSLESQYRSRLFAEPYDAVVLSINPDVMSDLLIHRDHGYPFYPGNSDRWSADQRSWLRDRFRPAGRLDETASMTYFEHIVARVRANGDAPILIYNMSSIVPGEDASCHLGLDESLSTRIRRFNLALIELSARTGVHIVDVDRIAACAGTDALKIDFIHYRPEGYRLMALEVARILEQEGVVDSVALSPADALGANESVIP